MKRQRKGAVGKTSSGVLRDVLSPYVPGLVDILSKMSVTHPELVN